MPDIKPCPHCGMQPRVYHGTYRAVYGDSVECPCDGFGADDEPFTVWNYTEWDLAVKRWSEYAERLACKT
jgi:hypothetical protein